jgi:uncharacterized protein (TIGR02466 family)
LELQTPFIASIGVFDVTEHLPYLRKLFVDRADNLLPVKADQVKEKFKTTMTVYKPLGGNNILDNSEEANKIRNAIGAAATEYANSCGNAGNNYMPTVVNFWLNEMESGQIHRFHSHPGMHFSGCIYVDMPENTSSIMFKSFKDRFDYMSLDVEKYTPFNARSWAFSPTEGQLYIWESWLQHGVEAAEYAGMRRSIAFDVVMI